MSLLPCLTILHFSIVFEEQISSNHLQGGNSNSNSTLLFPPLLRHVFPREQLLPILCHLHRPHAIVVGIHLQSPVSHPRPGCHLPFADPSLLPLTDSDRPALSLLSLSWAERSERAGTGVAVFGTYGSGATLSRYAIDGARAGAFNVTANETSTELYQQLFFRSAVLPDGDALEEWGTGPVAWSTGQDPADADLVLWAVGRVRPSTGWLPPDPPPGHGVHRYAFQLFALSATTGLSGSPGREAVADALARHAIASGLLIATYERPDGSVRVGSAAGAAGPTLA